MPDATNEPADGIGTLVELTPVSQRINDRLWGSRYGGLSGSEKAIMFDTRLRWGPAVPPHPQQKLQPINFFIDPEGTAWIAAREVGTSEPRCIDAADWVQYDIVGEEAA